MNINERIKYFRKDILHMNQTDFAESIGMKQRGASGMEQDGATVTDRAIKSICLVYNLNEDWLRTGAEPMYIEEPTFILDDFLRNRGATDLELNIVKAYFELEPDVRRQLVEHFKKHLAASTETAAPSAVEEAEAAYIKSRSGSAQNAGLSALNTTGDDPAEDTGSDKAVNN